MMDVITVSIEKGSHYSQREGQEERIRNIRENEQRKETPFMQIPDPV